MKNFWLVLSFCIFSLPGIGFGDPGKQAAFGLNTQAKQELTDAGLNKYLGQFTPMLSADVGDGWTKHTFDTDGGNGPICIAGTPFSVFTRKGNPSRLLIFEQGGGACWQDFYQCNILAESQEPPAPREGIWDFDSKDNPFADYSIVYMPYCDGSTFAGDNDVFDPSFPFGPVRFHRGLRNQSAGMDLAKATFPHASRITVAGSSAGGVGAAGFAPFLARFLFGNTVKLTVFNDAGPVAINLADVVGIMARAADWQFGQFYPAGCTDCSDMGQGTALIKWRLANDNTIREAFYSTDFDLTNRFFMKLVPPFFPDFVLGGLIYRDLIITEHGVINDLYPDRYKRFIQAVKFSHTALQTPLLYEATANGAPLNEWVEDFLVPRPSWTDLVEDLPPLP
jgi:hypothetical protein